MLEDSRPNTKTITLWRSLLREIYKITVAPVRSKTLKNARELFELHKEEAAPEKLLQLHESCQAAVRFLFWIRALPKVLSPSLCCCMTHG